MFDLKYSEAHYLDCRASRQLLIFKLAKIEPQILTAKFDIACPQ